MGPCACIRCPIELLPCTSSMQPCACWGVDPVLSDLQNRPPLSTTDSLTWLACATVPCPVTAWRLIKQAVACRPMKNTLSGNEGRGFMKILVASDTDTVVGVHLIGPETAEIIQVRCRHRADFTVRVLDVIVKKTLPAFSYMWPEAGLRPGQML